MEPVVEQTQCRYGKMYFFASDPIIGASLKQYGEWAQAEIDLLLDLLEPGSVVIDVGAFIGTHTLAFARRVGGQGQVYSFEPQPDHFRLLQQNVAENGLTNVKLFSIGLSDGNEDMSAEIYDPLRSMNFGAASLAPWHDTERRHRVTARKLDDLSLGKCDFIKLDTEGMEARILKGATASLKTWRPIVYAECNSLAKGWRIIEIMGQFNYEVRLHTANPYNLHNYRNNENNIFAGAREVGLLFIPAERETVIEKKCERHNDLFPIVSLDDLALGLLKKPQYKNEVLAKTMAARFLGVEFWANEAELAILRSDNEIHQAQLTERSAQLNAVQEEARRQHAEVLRLTEVADSLQAEVTERSAQLSAVQEEARHQHAEVLRLTEVADSLRDEVTERDRRLVEITGSMSWKIGGPVRVVKRYLNRIGSRIGYDLQPPATNAQEKNSPQGLLYSVDLLRVHGRRIYGWGWILGQKEILAVKINARVENGAYRAVGCTYGFGRSDVAATYPQIPGAGQCGYVISGWLPDELVEEFIAEVQFRDGSSQSFSLGFPISAHVPGSDRFWEMRRLLKGAFRHLRRGDFAELSKKVGAKRRALAKTRRDRMTDANALFKHLRECHSRVTMIIDHNLGGGANLYRERFMRERLQRGSAVLLLYYDLPTLCYVVKIFDGRGDRIFRLHSLRLLVEFAQGASIEEIFVNNLVSLSEPLTLVDLLSRFRDLSGARLTVAVHDYFMICPSWTLLDYRGKFCGIPEIATCRECMARHAGAFTQLVRERNIDKWRTIWLKCLGSADSILCFSRSAAELVKRAYPHLDNSKIVVKPHTVDYLPRREITTKTKRALHIGVVGEIVEHKGSGIIREMAEAIVDQGLPVRITVIGTIDAPCNPSVVSVTGPYQIDQLSDLIERHGITVCFIPSVWPETFSYVTEELMHLMMPLAVFDLGAPAERVRQYSQGLVIEEIDAVYALRKLVEFDEQLKNHDLETSSTIKSATAV